MWAVFPSSDYYGRSDWQPSNQPSGGLGFRQMVAPHSFMCWHSWTVFRLPSIGHRCALHLRDSLLAYTLVALQFGLRPLADCDPVVRFAVSHTAVPMVSGVSHSHDRFVARGFLRSHARS